MVDRMSGDIRGPAGVYVGTSGWAYSDWKEVLYPPGLKPSDRLAFYAARFTTLEINATFYRLPNSTTIEAWNRQLPESFHLVVKGPRSITHLKKLADYRQDLDLFWNRVKALRTLRMLLWQLPPSQKKDVKLLERFLDDLPTQVRQAVEFRHESWWDDEVVDLLSQRGVAMVAVSHPAMPEAILPTCDLLYVRFHGLSKHLYHYNYSDSELTAWTNRLLPHSAGRTVYAMFNNGYEGNAVRNAFRFRERMVS